MVRRHGWQLPAHAFQVVAITVFFLLAIAFYVFVAPFLGSDALQYISIAVYSPVAFAVFFLYVRCSAIDPSDPGIFVNQGQVFRAHEKRVEASPGSLSHKISNAEAGPGWSMPDKASRTSSLACLLCGWLTEEDKCARNNEAACPAVREEDVLFCTLCNAEVRKFSKHCRSCDKCVDGFDHHCRWLNNCVGKKNYTTFVSLMAASLTLLILQWVLGITVLVQCFVDKKGTEKQIINKLGASFTKAPFAAVVASCTIVSLLASLPLGELLFFHIILIKKGITTYEYVVAMRAQSEAPPAASVEGEPLSVPTSPTSSTATGLSVTSSLGLQYRGAWCTPPRIFVEQDEIIPQLGPGRVPSTVDPDSTLTPSRRDLRSQKRTVKISAWKLARLNPEEAARAVSRARAASSILRPLGPSSGAAAEADYVSNSNMSSRSSMSSDINYLAQRLAPGPPSSKLSGPRGSTAGGDDYLSSYSSPSYSMSGSGMLSPAPRGSNVINNNGSASAAAAATGVPASSSSGNPSPLGGDQQKRMLVYGGTSIFYTGPMSMPRPREASTVASNVPVQDDVAAATAAAIARSRAAALNRSQSPIFVPRQHYSTEKLPFH